MTQNDWKWVQIEAADNGVRRLTMNRPPVNALGRELVDDLTSAIGMLASDAEARVVVLRTDGKHFCAGADLKERNGMSIEDVRAFVPRLAGVCNALAALPVPTVAAIRGAAIGGGCELALGCDLRVVADDATLGLRETALAIIPGAGGTQRLPRLIGPSRAKHWIFSGAVHNADEALRDGVADRVVPEDRLDGDVAELADTIAANGPVAIRAAKVAIDGGAHLPLEEGLALEWRAYQKTLETSDREEALRAFAEKRTPEFRGS